MKRLETVTEVVLQLDGPAAVGRLTKRCSQAVSNWCARGSIPSRVFPTIDKALRKRGFVAAPTVFSFEEPSRKAKAA